MAGLKSSFIFSLQDISNSTEPNCWTFGPQEITDPLLRFISFIISFDGLAFFSLQDRGTRDSKIKNTGGNCNNNFFIF